MAWNTPTTVSTGDVLTASRYNADVQANLTELAPFFSAWTSFTPQLRTAAANQTSSVTYARYMKVGKIAWIQASVTWTGGTPTASGIIKLGLPSLTFAASPSEAMVCGEFFYKDSSAGQPYYVGAAVYAETGYISGTAYGSNNYMGAAAPIVTLAANDQVSYSIMLEVS